MCHRQLPICIDALNILGIHNYEELAMAAYLDLLLRANGFLASQADHPNKLVPIYLLATAGIGTAFKILDEEERIQRRKQILTLSSTLVDLKPTLA